MSIKNRVELIRKDLEITTEKTTLICKDEGVVEAVLNSEQELLDPLTSSVALNTKTHSKELITNKRRICNPERWKRNIRKKLRQSGKEYVNKSGQVTAERRVKPACSPKCYLKCAERFSEDQRQTIHNNFWLLTDVQKNYFYWKFTSRCEPKRRRTFSAKPKRSCTFHYRFEVRGELKPVCSKFFFATLDITSIRIYYFYEHCYRGDICMPRELRSEKPESDLANLAERLDVIREHIASFPSEKINGIIKKRYLSANLNLARMYKMYSKNVADPLKQNWYFRVFKEEFNLDFRLPSKTNSQKERIKNGIEVEEDNVSVISEMVEPQPTISDKLPVQLAGKAQPTTETNLSGGLAEKTQPTTTIKSPTQLAGQLPQLAGQLPQLAGQLPQLAGQLPQLAGQLPQLAGQLPQLAGQLPQLAPLQWNESNISLVKPNMEVRLPTNANTQIVHINPNTVDTSNYEFETINAPMIVQVPAAITSASYTTPVNIQLVESQSTIPGVFVELAQQLPLPEIQSALPLQWTGNNITMSIQSPYSNYGWYHQRY